MRKCYLSLSQVCSLCTCHVAQRNQTWLPSPFFIIYSIRKQCAGQRISKKFCNGKLLIKASKLPIQWHQFDYTHGIMEYPSCKLLRGGSTSSLPAARRKHEVATQINGYRSCWDAQSAPYQNGREEHSGRLNVIGRETSRETSHWVNKPESTETAPFQRPGSGFVSVAFKELTVNFLPPRAGLHLYTWLPTNTIPLLMHISLQGYKHWLIVWAKGAKIQMSYCLLHC